jgi:hypothetical protein
VEHPHFPMHRAGFVLKELHTFDLVRVLLSPRVVIGQIKTVAEDTLISRFSSTTVGEKKTLARRASGRIAGELLSDSDGAIVRAALNNPRLTEAQILKALNRPTVSAELLQALRLHRTWSLRTDIREAVINASQAAVEAQPSDE